jgi:tRNA(fMet)-specific endonuclease VapC
MYILDTDHLTILERGGIIAVKLKTKLANISSEQIAVTIITYEEQTRGWLGYISKCRTLEEQVIAYSKLEKHLKNFSKMRIIAFDNESATIFKQLRKDYPRLGTMDLKIAAIALAKGATLLTRNRADFENIANLKIEDWTN